MRLYAASSSRHAPTALGAQLSISASKLLASGGKDGHETCLGHRTLGSVGGGATGGEHRRDPVARSRRPPRRSCRVHVRAEGRGRAVRSVTSASPSETKPRCRNRPARRVCNTTDGRPRGRVTRGRRSLRIVLQGGGSDCSLDCLRSCLSWRRRGFRARAKLFQGRRPARRCRCGAAFESCATGLHIHLWIDDAFVAFRPQDQVTAKQYVAASAIGTAQPGPMKRSRIFGGDGLARMRQNERSELVGRLERISTRRG